MVLQQTSALLDEDARQIIASQQHQIEMLAASIDRLVADSAEERRATREDLKELRDLTRENSEAIRDLLNLAPRQPAPGRS